MTTHSSILAWRIPMDRGAWWATVLRVAESDTTDTLNSYSSWAFLVAQAVKNLPEIRETRV